VARAAAVHTTLLQRVDAAAAAVATRRGGWLVAGIAAAVFALESIALPVVPGRDFGTYLRTYAQLADWHSPLPMTMLYRTPVAPVVVGVPLDVAGGWALLVAMALLFAASVLLWTRTALVFGARAALLTAVALLLYPGYTILFHRPASDPVTGAAFAVWAYLLARAVSRPTPGRFAAAGAAVALAALARPGNQVLAALCVVALLARVPWRGRILAAVAYLAAAAVLLGGWAVLNGLRYDDYAVARGGNAFLPFFRSFVTDHTVAPDNGPASRRLAAAVRRDLLTREPYRSRGIGLEAFFAKGNDREFEDLVNLSDRIDGWDSDYRLLRDVGTEAVRAHPGTYARGVASTVVRELWHPLYVALPDDAPAAAATGAGDGIPAARQGFYTTTPHGSAREVWTSPTQHRLVFADPADARRNAAVERKVERLAAGVPPYRGSAWGTRQLSRSSKLFPPPLLWLLVGAAGLVLRRPRRSLAAWALAAGALVVTLFNALTIYPIIEFAIPLMPALVVCGAAGLLGVRDPRAPAVTSPR
jgi:hypothetical protein